MATHFASRHGCRVVKFIGDEAMLVGTDPSGVAEAAARLCAAVARDEVLPSARGAVGYGIVSPRGGDYFGEVVNFVARATKEAPNDGLVATREVAAQLDPARWIVGAPRPVSLRGVPEDLELFDVALDSPSA